MPKKFHSRQELEEARRKSGYGSEKIRLGKDSQQAFGYCCISLKPAQDPVATPSGHIYSRESILEYLLDKKRQLQAQKRAYAEQEENRKAKALNEEKRQHQEEVNNFIKSNKSFDGGRDAKRKLNYKEELEERRVKKKVDDRSREEKVSELGKTSYWLSQFTPGAEEKEIEKPPKRPPSPISGKPLKIGDLHSVTFDFAPQNKDQIVCAVSNKVITHQKVVLVKPSERIVLKSVFDEIIQPTMTCPITNEKLQKSDILHLQSGGTAFSQHNSVQASKYRPNLV
mmetsp:Transcript_16992/g.27508  ORF Transcript_16992/g.27508 Transcript_16992/m.27508 type:complete len:283 (-) Transcript_16992:617-1465(-)|eukprot:CAMPEP_0203752132 /NCGR_PEP_ID=MMETSP0098-20131031/6091_1 /ASSEMBLY_ACC=CAM_ASM_000208 /TAXON_ID=96639 /ORGANISM=" , Strain NY0313808BC1" /LENGTH=282 /DNA_ID=CAMNT_0050642155 /DNA_START=351 /DNA_END=1199 /DNA_ORIENTATION=+